MKTILRILLHLLVIESVLAVHEYGHLQEFRKSRVPVQEFSLGVGPVLYHYKSGSMDANLRLFPLMAYVAPTKEGDKFFDDHVPFLRKISIHTAGVRNNFLTGLVIVLFLQVLGWIKGNLSFLELLKTAISTPFRLLLRYLSFVVGCITWGKVNFTDRFLLSTGGIVPPKLVSQFVLWNLLLGILNLAPIPPLDGSHAVEALLQVMDKSIHFSEMPRYVSFFLFVVFYSSVQEQDNRILEIEPRKKDPWEEEWERRILENQQILKDGSLYSLRLSTRVVNRLRNSNIFTVGDLLACTAERLLLIPGFGKKSLKEVEEVLIRRGLKLRT